MDIDNEIANWILEFLLRQPLEDRVLNSLLRVLPLSHDNLNLQKLLLLKKLDSDVSRHLVYETTLDLLEQLEELEHQLGHESVSDTMKHAYFAVVVECSLKLVAAGDNEKIGSREFKFLEMAKRLWRNRVCRMKGVLENGGLGSERLWEWKDAIEAAVWNDSECDSVLMKFQGVQAEEAVRDYLREEREKMGPSFLELVAEAAKNHKVLQLILGKNDGVTGRVDRVAGEETPSQCVDRVAGEETPSQCVDRVAGEETPSQCVDRVAGEETPSHCVDRVAGEETPTQCVEETPLQCVDRVAGEETPSLCVDRVAGEETPSECVDRVAGEETPSQCVDRVAREEAPSQCVDRAASGSSSGKEIHKGEIKPRHKLVGLRRRRGLASGSSRGAKIVDSDETLDNSEPHSAEFNKAKEALELSSMEIRAAVKDPLPDALRVAEAISSQARENKCQDPAASNDARPSLFTVDVTGIVQSSETANNVPRPSLMEQKSSAHLYEWDKSIDGSQEDLACRALHQVSSPKRINTSPSKVDTVNNLKKRRKGRRWSLLEEDTLRDGVEKFGIGNWKVIKTVYQDIFEGRTEVDLKDKWRNLMR